MPNRTGYCARSGSLPSAKMKVAANLTEANSTRLAKTAADIQVRRRAGAPASVRGRMRQMYNGERQTNAYTKQPGTIAPAACSQPGPPDAPTTYTSKPATGSQAAR